MKITTVSPTNNATVSGNIRWEAKVSNGTPDQVEFRIDAVVDEVNPYLYIEKHSPYVYNGDFGFLDTTKLPNGTHKLGVRAIYNGRNVSNQVVYVNVQNVVAPPPPPPPPPPTGVWWTGPVPPTTAFPSATPTLPDITDQAGLQALLKTGSTAHGVVRVKPFIFQGSLDLGVRSSGLVVIFEDGWKLIGPSGSAYPGVEAHCGGVHLYGGDVSNPHGGSGTSGGDGVKVKVNTSDPTGTEITWKGLKIHDTASQGFSVQGSRFPIKIDVEVEVSRWGLNTNLDPHDEKGTGIHGAYIGGGLTPTNGSAIVYAHDGGTGAGLELGANAQNMQLWLSVKNLTWTKDGNAGWGFMPWGGSNSNVTVKNLLVDGATGAIYDGSLSSGPITIEYCRYKNLRSNVQSSSNSHVIIQDIAKYSLLNRLLRRA